MKKINFWERLRMLFSSKACYDFYVCAVEEGEDRHKALYNSISEKIEKFIKDIQSNKSDKGLVIPGYYPHEIIKAVVTLDSDFVSIKKSTPYLDDYKMTSREIILRTDTIQGKFIDMEMEMDKVGFLREQAKKVLINFLDENGYIKYDIINSGEGKMELVFFINSANPI